MCSMRSASLSFPFVIASQDPFFTVTHFAGDVSYDVVGWLDKVELFFGRDGAGAGGLGWVGVGSDEREWGGVGWCKGWIVVW